MDDIFEREKEREFAERRDIGGLDSTIAANILFIMEMRSWELAELIDAVFDEFGRWGMKKVC